MPEIKEKDRLAVGIAQMAPVWMNREKTLEKVAGFVERAGRAGCRLVVFGEALVPGYPFWLEHTGGARFNDPVQKDLHAHYLDQAVQIESGHLEGICAEAGRWGTAVYLGCIERPRDRGGHSLYCSLVYIDAGGTLRSVHRKLMPTYEERLVWSQGDGHGMRVHPLGPFTAGGLNCWENWMPLARAAMTGQGEDLHVAVWPGGPHNTRDITRFMAMESRSYVVSASGLMTREAIDPGVPHNTMIQESVPDVLASGGSCIAGPDGAWVVEPVAGDETLITATLDHQRVRAERQNFDPVGHYSRPDVTRLVLDRRRQSTIEIDPDTR